MDLETKQASTCPWTHTVGILAWSPLPPEYVTRLNNKFLDAEWPCILYPSWSNAMLRSGLVTNQKVVSLIGCKKPISVDDLGKNRVPSRLALGSGENGSKYRPKVVAYYLGFGEEPAWGSVKVEMLKQYTFHSVVEKLRDIDLACEHLPENHNVWHERMALAMLEASIVMERPEYSPCYISKDVGLKNVQKVITYQWEGHAEKMSEPSPENFDQWRLGGDSQTNTQSQTQNFSHVTE